MVKPMKQDDNEACNYPSNYQFSQGARPSIDWLSSPVQSVPDWSVERKQNDAYAASPVSSPGIYTPANSDSWNCFDESFKKEIATSPLTTPITSSFGQSFGSQAPWNPVWPPAFDSRASLSRVPMSLIQDPVYLEDGEDEAGNEVAEPDFQYMPPNSSSVEAPSTLRKANWGTPNRPRHTLTASSSGATRHSSRNTQKEVQNSTNKSSKSSTNGHQLRSTKAGHKITYAEKKSPSEGHQGARASHNLVEKQYRNRLNGQFSTLLSALPPELIGTETESCGRGDAPAERRVSKAEVLVLARKHIQNLETTKKNLECDKKALMTDVQRLKEAWLAQNSDTLVN